MPDERITGGVSSRTFWVVASDLGFCNPQRQCGTLVELGAACKSLLTPCCRLPDEQGHSTATCVVGSGASQPPTACVATERCTVNADCPCNKACVATVCCPKDRACMTKCCAEGQVCLDQKTSKCGKLGEGEIQVGGWGGLFLLHVFTPIHEIRMVGCTWNLNRFPCCWSWSCACPTSRPRFTCPCCVPRRSARSRSGGGHRATTAPPPHSPQ